MNTPDARMKNDRPLKVRCRCGAVLTILDAGISVVTSHATNAQSRVIPCGSCGKETTIYTMRNPVQG